MYEQALRVPWMIRYPGKVKAGVVRPEWVVNIDNAPTVLDLAGLPIPSAMQGKSVKPMLGGGAGARLPEYGAGIAAERIAARLLGSAFAAHDAGQRGIRRGAAEPRR
ncbi:MAG: sulfatase/phosphatase domain-containing protein [Acetobacteraceae bacterium]